MWKMTREQWLTEAVMMARPMFEEAGSPLPDKLRVAMAPPAKKINAIGLCWPDGVSKDGGREIWVCASLADPIEVAKVLVHECCHAALPASEKHGKEFIKLGKKLLLEGKAKYMTGGAAFEERWEPLVDDLGPFPGVEFKRQSGATGSRYALTFKNVNCPVCRFHAKIRLDQMKRGRLVCPADGELLLTKEERGED